MVIFNLFHSAVVFMYHPDPSLNSFDMIRSSKLFFLQELLITKREVHFNICVVTKQM